MGASTNYQWPYPDPATTVDIPRDIKALALAADASMYPIGRHLGHTDQVSSPLFNVTGTVVDFTAAEWPRPVIQVPPGGRVAVFATASLYNGTSANSTCTLGWRTTTAGVVIPLGGNMASISGGGFFAGKAFVIWGMVPGTSVTLIPTWRISSGTAATAAMASGMVDIVALQG